MTNIIHYKFSIYVLHVQLPCVTMYFVKVLEIQLVIIQLLLPE